MTHLSRRQTKRWKKCSKCEDRFRMRTQSGCDDESGEITAEIIKATRWARRLWQQSWWASRRRRRRKWVNIASNRFLGLISSPSSSWASPSGLSETICQSSFCTDFWVSGLTSNKKDSFFYKFEASFYFHLGIRDRNREMCSILFSSTTCPRPSAQKRNISRSCKTLKHISRDPNGWLWESSIFS